MDIQAITTLLCLLLVLRVLFPSIHSFFYLTDVSCPLYSWHRSPEKWRFPALKSLLLPEFSTYRHRAGFILKRKQVRFTNYGIIPKNMYIFFLQIFKVVYFAEKKRIHKIYYSFFKKPIIGNTYIFTKCIDNFKFSMSIKSYEE